MIQLIFYSCHPTSKCVNTEGHFECQCTEEEEPDCKLSCIFEDAEVLDGATVSPRNAPCKVCKCSRGVITCEDTPCNCSTWKRGNGRDLCCPQCDPRESCQHQELKHVTFRSGEQWIYQCQQCECLVSILHSTQRSFSCLLILFISTCSTVNSIAGNSNVRRYHAKTHFPCSRANAAHGVRVICAA